MTSLQQSAPSSKSAKFVAAKPLDPMIKPFEDGGGLNDEAKDLQETLADNVNRRLEKAMGELVDKHAKGTNEVDHPDRAPTGPAYQAIARQRAQMAAAAAQQQKVVSLQAQQRHEQQVARLTQLQRQVAKELNEEENDDEDGSDDDYDDLLDDPALDDLRDRRLHELKAAHATKLQNLALGHGQYRTISQDEFLPECTGSSQFVAVHFFHNDFQRCLVMDHHLKEIAARHLGCKFVRINAEKAPFFVSKLQIRTLPTVLVFCNGKTVDRLTGFEGLTTAVVDDTNPARVGGQPSNIDPDQWETSRLEQWLSKTGAIEYTPSAEQLREEMDRLGLRQNSKKKSAVRSSLRQFEDEL